MNACLAPSTLRACPDLNCDVCHPSCEESATLLDDLKRMMTQHVVPLFWGSQRWRDLGSQISFLVVVRAGLLSVHSLPRGETPPLRWRAGLPCLHAGNVLGALRAGFACLCRVTAGRPPGAVKYVEMSVCACARGTRMWQGCLLTEGTRQGRQMVTFSCSKLP